MCAIYKKELRAYLTSMTGYIFMAVLLAVTSLYYVANCLVGGYPVFGAVLSSVYFVMLIIGESANFMEHLFIKELVETVISVIIVLLVVKIQWQRNTK